MILLAARRIIGVRDEPEAQDEYDDYVPGHLGLLRKGVDADVIAEHLRRIEIEEMGLPPDGARASRAELNLRDVGF